MKNYNVATHLAKDMEVRRLKNQEKFEYGQLNENSFKDLKTDLTKIFDRYENLNLANYFTKVSDENLLDFADVYLPYSHASGMPNKVFAKDKNCAVVFMPKYFKNYLITGFEVFVVNYREQKECLFVDDESTTQWRKFLYSIIEDKKSYKEDLKKLLIQQTEDIITDITNPQ